MKASPLLVMVMSVVTLGGILYAAFAFRATPHVPPVAVASSSQANAREGGHARELATLRHDFERLRAELHAWRSTDADARRRRTAGDTENPPQKLVDELSHLQAEVATLRTHVRKTAAIATPTAVGSDDASTTPLRTVADMATLTQAQEQRDREHLAFLDTAMQAEGVDTHWAFDTTELLTGVLESEELAAMAVHDLECRTTVCRLEVEYDNTQAMDQFALLFPMQVGEALPQLTFFHQQLADGRSHTVIYLARQGHSR